MSVSLLEGQRENEKVVVEEQEATASVASAVIQRGSER